MTDNFLKLGGAPEGYDAALIVKEFEKSSSYVLHVARDDKRMAAVKDALTFFAPDILVKIFPSWVSSLIGNISNRSRAAYRS